MSFPRHDRDCPGGCQGRGYFTTDMMGLAFIECPGTSDGLREDPAGPLLDEACSVLSNQPDVKGVMVVIWTETHVSIKHAGQIPDPSTASATVFELLTSLGYYAHSPPRTG